jgi:hypothetical protein
LSLVLLCLLLLAFLCRTVLQIANAAYQTIRAHLVTRRDFFNDIRTLTRYMLFESWETLLAGCRRDRPEAAKVCFLARARL